MNEKLRDIDELKRFQRGKWNKIHVQSISYLIASKDVRLLPLINSQREWNFW